MSLASHLRTPRDRPRRKSQDKRVHLWGTPRRPVFSLFRFRIGRGRHNSPWAIFQGPSGPLFGTKKTARGGSGHPGLVRPPILKHNWETSLVSLSPEDGLGGPETARGGTTALRAVLKDQTGAPLVLKQLPGGPGHLGLLRPAILRPNWEASLGSLGAPRGIPRASNSKSHCAI